SKIIRAKQQLEIYKTKFKSQLSSRNRMFIKQIFTLLRRLDAFLTTNKGTAGQVTASELLLDGTSTGGLDQINFYKVEKYLRISGLAMKVEGYDTHTTKNDD